MSSAVAGWRKLRRAKKSERVEGPKGQQGRQGHRERWDQGLGLWLMETWSVIAGSFFVLRRSRSPGGGSEPGRDPRGLSLSGTGRYRRLPRRNISSHRGRYLTLSQCWPTLSQYPPISADGSSSRQNRLPSPEIPRHRQRQADILATPAYLRRRELISPKISSRRGRYRDIVRDKPAFRQSLPISADGSSSREK